jgi:hypothetical protein
VVRPGGIVDQHLHMPWTKSATAVGVLTSKPQTVHVEVS